jgi:hypothetical protein
MPPIDFELPTDAGESLSYDAGYREGKTTLLTFYRGHW